MSWQVGNVQLMVATYVRPRMRFRLTLVLSLSISIAWSAEPPGGRPGLSVAEDVLLAEDRTTVAMMTKRVREAEAAIRAR